MRAVLRKERLALAVPLSLLLLLVGVVGLGLAVRSGDIVPPALDVGIGHTRIAAYRTHYLDCPPYMFCPPESVSLQAYYVIWSADQLPTVDQRYGRTAHRLLAVPLQR